tara:strand:+ start:138 stop:776 length:639 start_codon:yes stop_codon:yes gene_type:complete
MNAIESLRRLGLHSKLECYCVGDECFSTLSKNNMTCHKLDNNVTDIQTFRKGNWNLITLEKLNIIHQNMKKSAYVCITDGDIVFERPGVLQYCLDNIGDNDMLIQNDRMDDMDDSILCSGFMFIRSTKRTNVLFDPKRTSKYIGPTGMYLDDQAYINHMKQCVRIKKLPLNLFPNGQYYYKNGASNPYIIHFNWCIHDKKEEFMKTYGKWLI